MDNAEMIRMELQDQDGSVHGPAGNTFMAPSVHHSQVLIGESYTHHSAIPELIAADMEIECVLGVDEAGRGPVLGPMVYALYYLPLPLHHSLLAETHHFNDSKVLTPASRSELMEKICTSNSDLYTNCGWATRVMSARDISSGQLRSSAPYNLNAQAMDATIDLIKDVVGYGINIREVYIDTIGSPTSYQKKLERIFPSLSITVAKKADSLYPCVSAASVCAKVTRDAALEIMYAAQASETFVEMAWGSGYPSDVRCANWLRMNMHPVFGWGNECRFSWSTAKELLEAKGTPCHAEWPHAEDAGDNMKLTGFLSGATEAERRNEGIDPELRAWFGQASTEIGL